MSWSERVVQSGHVTSFPQSHIDRLIDKYFIHPGGKFKTPNRLHIKSKLKHSQVHKGEGIL